ncbi:MAG: HAD family phosphatase [Planctomycetota bacterium]
MIPIQSIIFDMDGLLLDSERIYRTAWQKATQEQGFSLSDSGYEEMIGRSTHEGEMILAERLSSKFNVALFKNRWETIRDTIIEKSGVPLKPGVNEILSFLEGKKIRKAIATSSTRKDALKSLAGHSVLQQMDALITADQVQRSKPAPDLFLKALETLKAQALHTLVLEDSEAGVRAAQTAQIRVILVPDLKSPQPSIRKVAFRCFSSLFEVKEFFQSHEKILFC